MSVAEQSVGAGGTRSLHAILHNGKEESTSVLLVEDQAFVLKVTAEVLKRAGYKVLTATTGLEARQRFEQAPLPVTVVIADMVLPDANGCKLAEELRRLTPALKVILTSGYSKSPNSLAVSSMRLPPRSTLRSTRSSFKSSMCKTDSAGM